MKPILLIAAGNSLAGDDGVGPAIARELEKSAPPEIFRIAEVHTDILALGRLWRNETRVWIVDALARGDTPGTIHHLHHEELLKISQGQRHAHALSLPENLRWLLFARPEMSKIRFRAWGIEPFLVGKGDSLSPPVAAAVPRVLNEILRVASVGSLP